MIALSVRRLCNAVLLAGIITGAGCSTFTAPMRTHQLKTTEGRILDFDVTRRSAYVVPTKTPNSGITDQVLAEQSPDAGLNVVAEFIAKLNYQNVTGEASAKISQNIAELTKRSQTLMVLREALYRANEMRFNGLISEDSYATMHQRIMRAIVVISLIELEKINDTNTLAKAGGIMKAFEQVETNPPAAVPPPPEGSHPDENVPVTPATPTSVSSNAPPAPHGTHAAHPVAQPVTTPPTQKTNPPVATVAQPPQATNPMSDFVERLIGIIGPLRMKFSPQLMSEIDTAAKNPNLSREALTSLIDRAKGSIGAELAPKMKSLGNNVFSLQTDSPQDRELQQMNDRLDALRSEVTQQNARTTDDTQKFREMMLK